MIYLEDGSALLLEDGSRLCSERWPGHHSTPEYVNPAGIIRLSEWAVFVVAGVSDPATLSVSVTVDYLGYDPTWDNGDGRSNRYVENVMVWVDGEAIDASTSGSLSGAQRAALGHTFRLTKTTPRHWEYLWTFNRANLLTEGGAAVPVRVNLFDNGYRYAGSPSGIASVVIPVDIPAVVKPTVPLWPKRTANLRPRYSPRHVFCHQRHDYTR